MYPILCRNCMEIYDMAISVVRKKSMAPKCFKFLSLIMTQIPKIIG